MINLLSLFTWRRELGIGFGNLIVENEMLLKISAVPQRWSEKLSGGTPNQRGRIESKKDEEAVNVGSTL